MRQAHAEHSSESYRKENAMQKIAIIQHPPMLLHRNATLVRAVQPVTEATRAGALVEQVACHADQPEVSASRAVFSAQGPVRCI
jgi:hypothetical protein